LLPMPEPDRPWFTPGVRGIGLASLLSDAGHEIPTALLPSLLTSVLGAPAVALGVIEGIADALSGGAKFVGGALADDAARRQSIAVGGYTLTAVLSALIGGATATWQVGVLRAGAWTSRGIRGPARNALLADAVDRSAYGRAYGFERSMDNLGAVVGPILAVVLVALVGIRGAILLSVIPGLLAAGAIVYAIRHLQRPPAARATALRFTVRSLLRGPLGRLFVGIGAFELVVRQPRRLVVLGDVGEDTEGEDPGSEVVEDEAEVTGVGLLGGLSRIEPFERRELVLDLGDEFRPHR